MVGEDDYESVMLLWSVVVCGREKGRENQGGIYRDGRQFLGNWLARGSIGRS